MARSGTPPKPPQYKLGTVDLVRWLRTQTDEPVSAFMKFISARDYGKPELTIREFKAMFNAMSPANEALVAVPDFKPTHVDVSAHMMVMIEEAPEGGISVLWPNGLRTQEPNLTVRYIPLGDLRRQH